MKMKSSLQRQLLFLILWFVLCLFFSVTKCHGDEDEEMDQHKNKVVKLKESIVVLIAFDGFRYDYLYRLKTLKKESVFWKLIKNGAIYDADGITPSFATLTTPNLYTIATGLFQENHGIIANSAYNRITNEIVDLKADSSKYLYGGEPIWTTVTNGKISVGCYMWLGCQFGNLKNFVPQSPTVTWSQTVDQVVQWLKNGVQFVMVYWTEPDSVGHFHGPDSFQLNQTLVEIDDQVEVLIRHIEMDNALKNKVNLIFTSDHGMANVITNITVPSRPDLFTVEIQDHPFWHIQPANGKLKETVDFFHQLSPFLEVYEKDNIPEYWHYKHNDRIGAVLVVAKAGYFMISNNSIENVTYYGHHGYSPDISEMRPFFVADGHAFKKVDKSFNIANTDIYLLICKIFGVVPSPNNGSTSTVELMLNNEYLKKLHHVGNSVNLWIVSMTSTAVVLFILVLYFMHRASYEKRKRLSNISSFPKQQQNGMTEFVYHKIKNEQMDELLPNKILEKTDDDSDVDSI